MPRNQRDFLMKRKEVVKVGKPKLPTNPHSVSSLLEIMKKKHPEEFKEAFEKLKKNCCICGCLYIGYGNNPYPLCDEDDHESRACDNCNHQYVIQARMMNSGEEPLITKDNWKGYRDMMMAYEKEK